MTLLTRQPELAASWLADFEHHRNQHANVVLAPNPDLGPDRAGLTASLAVFQVGESGGGSRLFAAADQLGIGSDYRRALELFIAEEQEHARLLALVLGTANAPTRSSHWSDRIFVWARQLFGLRGEILMLLVAELIALSYYGMLRDSVPDTGVAHVFGRIHTDEQRHVAFHADTLPPLLRRMPRWQWWLGRWIWNITVTGTSIVVAADHAAARRVANLSAGGFVASVWRDRRDLDRALFS